MKTALILTNTGIVWLTAILLGHQSYLWILAGPLLGWIQGSLERKFDKKCTEAITLDPLTEFKAYKAKLAGLIFGSLLVHAILFLLWMYF